MICNSVDRGKHPAKDCDVSTVGLQSGVWARNTMPGPYGTRGISGFLNPEREL